MAPLPASDPSSFAEGRLALQKRGLASIFAQDNTVDFDQIQPTR